MESFKAALINEIEKLYKRKKIIAAAVLSIIFIIFGQIIMIGLRNGFGVRTVGSMEFPMVILSVVANTIIPLFAALITIDSFSGEYSQNTMKIAITRPVSRLKFFTAKIAAVCLFIFTNLMFIMIFSVIAGIIFNSNTLSFMGIVKIAISYIVTLIPMIILVLFIVIFTNFFRSGAGVFFLCILFFLGFKVLEVVLTQYSSIFFTSMLTWYNLWIMDKFPVITIFRQFMLMLSYGIILFTVGYYLFDKKEF